MTERYGERRDHPADEPAPTLTGKARSDEWVYVNGNQPNAAERERAIYQPQRFISEPR